MATVTGTPYRRAPRDEKVYHPLDRLRAIIRRYVLIEGVLSVLLFLVAWFALALVLDFGVFKAFGWDWVRDGAFGIRVAALAAAVALLGGILVFRIVRRLTKEFSYPALALVLERRFPKVLGDRLITAVELADVEGQAKFGYSADMIRRTIDEARERVATVPVSEAFNWRRLRVMGLVLVGSVVALLVGGFAAHAIAARDVRPVHAAWDMAHNSAILVERDLLLWNTPWRRRALLELRDPQDGNKVLEGGIRVARDGPPPRVRVKAFRWVVADRSKPDGWRALLWADVTDGLVGVPVPTLPGVGPERTADSVLEDAAARSRLQDEMGADRYGGLQRVFDRLEEMAADPRNGRRLRKLDRPSAVTLKYVGLQTAGDSELKPEGDSEYAGDVTGLKEDVLFTVRAEDYRTRDASVTLIPPPTLAALTAVKFEPAYLHYASPRVPDPNNPDGPPVVGGWSLLSGLRQRVQDEKLSLTGDRTTFVVRAGSEVVLTGVTERPVARAWAVPKVGRVPGATPGSAAPVPVAVGSVEEPHGDRTITRGSFTLEFRGADRVTAPVEFDFHFENEDGVRSKREVMVQVTEDEAPVVELVPDVVRKVGPDFWVTPKARVPFNPESNVRDNAGLSKVAYRVAYEPTDAAVVRALRAVHLGRDVVAHAAAGDLGAVAAAALRTAEQDRADTANAAREASFGLGRFVGLDERLDRKTLAHVRTLLGQPAAADRPELVKRIGLSYRVDLTSDYRWEVDGDYFDVGALKELEVAAGDVQPRYKLKLALEATDTNFDTGPRVGRQEPPVSILVVSEGDLLVEISKDEEKLGAKLDDALKRLAAARGKYAFVRSKADLQKFEEVEAVKVRSKDALQDVAKARETVAGVAREFRRVEKECVFNRMDEKTVVFYGKFANGLERVQDDSSPRPVSRDEADQVARKLLDPKASFDRVEKRMGGAQALFDEGRWPDPNVVVEADARLALLEEEVARLRNILGEAQSKDRLKNFLRSVVDQQKRIELALQKWETEESTKLNLPTPKLYPVGPQFLAKGETKKIRQGITWRQFKEDVLTVKVAASDPSLVVPAELKLDFEKNNVDFEYEVRAGTATGEFKVTLTPYAGDNPVGDPVEVQVSVK